MSLAEKLAAFKAKAQKDNVSTRSTNPKSTPLWVVLELLIQTGNLSDSEEIRNVAAYLAPIDIPSLKLELPPEQELPYTQHCFLYHSLYSYSLYALAAELDKYSVVRAKTGEYCEKRQQDTVILLLKLLLAKIT